MSTSTPESPQPELPGEPPVPPAPPIDPTVAAFNTRVAELVQAGDTGANWFYWVAGLSLVNSAIGLFGGGMYFVVGLAVTLVVDSIAAGIAAEAAEAAVIVKVISVGFDLFVAAVLCGFGFLSRKRILPVFAIGMVLYLLDGLIFLALQDWMSVAFHAFALYSMGNGFMAYRKLNQLRSQFAPKTS